MKNSGGKIAYARWIAERSGIVELNRDWERAAPPPIWHTPGRQHLARIVRADPFYYAERSGYFVDGERIIFVVLPKTYPQVDWPLSRLYVAGTFNSWGAVIEDREWQLQPKEVSGNSYLILGVGRGRCLANYPADFKFVTQNGQWLEIPSEAPNAVFDPRGVRNFRIDPHRTGKHIFEFEFKEDCALDERIELLWSEPEHEEQLAIDPGDIFLTLKSDLALGAMVDGAVTTFRIFSPRACSVAVILYDKLKDPNIESIELKRRAQGVWEGEYSEDLSGWFYHYRIDGSNRQSCAHFDSTRDILDPYAMAAMGPEGPGLIVDRRKIPQTSVPFDPPDWHDLVILEGHVRDLVSLAPIELEDRERLGFTGLRKWVESEGNYLTRLGVNTIELQPIHEFDAGSVEDYHWGYMPVNFFSPCSRYCLNPEEGSQIREFQELVATFHRQGLAVIIDVVYNHAGLPNHLQFIDKQYYFLVDRDGEHIDWSGCSNSLRCDTPMGRRLIIESLTHFIEVFDVDGFRFDLAEILGIELLLEIEIRLKRIKPSVILITEPWSLRGHIGHTLKTTGYASWNDGYRDFMREYLLGNGTSEGFLYYLNGSLGYLTAWPTQTVNYVESHDDHCWLDLITENENRDGSVPTANDRRRTHLLIAVLMSSLGIPMLSAGQDMLRSKRGVRNTYMRGDLNAIDYKRAITYSNTQEYFRSWIRFRLSEEGRAFRHELPPPPHFLEFMIDPESTGVAVLYNARRSLDCRRLLFAINPHERAITIPYDGQDMSRFLLLADQAQFDSEGLRDTEISFGEEALHLPPLSCGLWLEEGMISG